MYLPSNLTTPLPHIPAPPPNGTSWTTPQSSKEPHPSMQYLLHLAVFLLLLCVSVFRKLWLKFRPIPPISPDVTTVNIAVDVELEHMQASTDMVSDTRPPRATMSFGRVVFRAATAPASQTMPSTPTPSYNRPAYVTEANATTIRSSTFPLNRQLPRLHTDITFNHRANGSRDSRPSGLLEALNSNGGGSIGGF